MQPNPWDDPSDAELPPVMQDSVVGGDVHTGDVIHNHYSSNEQPAQILVGMPQSTVADPYGQQMYALQPRSSASKVIGIFVVILGVLNVLGAIGAFIPARDPITGELVEMSTSVFAVNFVNSLAGSVFFILGGIWMTQYKRKGVNLVLLGVGVSFVLAMASTGLGGDPILNSLFGNPAALAVEATMNTVCSLICGLIVAIPLMNGAASGLDDSRLF